MRITNNTDKPLWIPPGKSINVKAEGNSTKGMSQRIPLISIKELKEQ